MSSPSFYADIFENQRNSVPTNYSEDVYYKFFGRQNVDFIANQITLRLRGVHPEGKNIIVPLEKIISVMDSIYNNTYRDVDKMTMMTISYIVDYISSEYEIEKQNKKLSIWVTNFLPEYRMQQTPKIKLREKRPATMIFNMNY
jgi:hypothetical protein